MKTRTKPAQASVSAMIASLNAKNEIPDDVVPIQKGPTPQVEPTWAYGIYTGRAVVTKNQKGGVK
jgi:hypothetical protein